MTEPTFNRSKLPKIMTYQSYQRLDGWIKRQSSTPYPLSVKDYFHQSDHREYHSRQLEKIIIRLLTRSGCIAQKIKNTGKFIDKTKVVSDVVGRSRQIGSKEYVRDANVIKGMADIRADVWGGLTWYIEIKIDDRQSDDQKEFESKVNALGHHYSIVRTVDEFLLQFKQLTGKELI